jgi:hypothetical protein
VEIFILGTVSVIAVAMFLIIYRYTGKMDSNLPMVFNLMIGAHMMTFEDGLSPTWVYVALVCALFLRFEFMNRIFVRLVRTIETIALGYIIWRGVSMIQAF